MCYRARNDSYVICINKGEKEIMKSNERVKILFVVESFSTGVYSIVHDIACNIDPSRFEVTIIHSLRPDSPATYKEDFANTGVSLIYIPMNTAKNLIASIGSIRRTMKEYKPDVIHLHSSMAGAVGRIAAKGHFKGLLLYTPHGYSFLKQDVSKIKRWMFKTTEKVLAFLFGGTILAVSDNEYKLSKEISSKVKVIHNFIDVRKIPQVEMVRKNTVAICGRISVPRNPSLFNTIALALPNVSFLWIGDGPLREHITAPNITVTGLLSRVDALKLVSEATMYIQTSLWEGLSVSVLEAMALKKAVVASNIDANKELIDHGVNGFLCQVASSSEFIDNIKTLLQDEKMRKEFGEEGYKKVIEKYDLSVAIKRYEEVYEKENVF